MEHCFYHPERDAVAVCSKCGKPLCKECAIEYKGKIYCKDCLAEIKKKEEPAKSEKFEKTSPQKEENTKRNTARIVITAIIISAIIIGGIIMLALFAKPKSGGGIINNNANNFSENEFSVPSAGTSVDIRADISKADIKIVRSDETNGKITVTGTNIRPHVTYLSNTLEITTPSEILPWEKHKNREITVKVPGKVTRIFTHIESSVGNVYISLPSGNIENANILTKVGDTVIENSNIDTLYLTDVTGDTELNNVSITNCKIKNGTGDCEINGGSFKTLSIKQGTGDCNISAVKSIRELSYNGGTGDFTMDLSQILPPMNATIQTGMGETEIKVGENPARITVTAGMGLNDSSLPATGRVLVFGNVNNPHFEITITSGGKVRIGR
jgi:hypothetical protein